MQPEMERSHQPQAVLTTGSSSTVAVVAVTACEQQPQSSSSCSVQRQDQQQPAAPMAATSTRSAKSKSKMGGLTNGCCSSGSSHRRSSSKHHRSRNSGGGRSSRSVARDQRYFARLREMKVQYRDEVALVFRELCRVNTVIQHSASLRRHESNNLGDFLANLKKIIYLLEQQPDEMSGMIPAKKRSVEYLDVVESHICRKVLPILRRLRLTYSTILRPIVLNYLKNSSSRFSRRPL